MFRKVYGSVEMNVELSLALGEAKCFFGGYSEKVTPVPIPNTVVKLLCADNTWRATSREHKSPPELFFREQAYCSLKIFLFKLYIPL